MLAVVTSAVVLSSAHHLSKNCLRDLT
jgi:hypothetical protein